MSVKVTQSIQKPLLINNIEFAVETFSFFCLHPKSRHYCIQSDFEIQGGIEGTIRVYPRGTDDDMIENWLSIVTSVRSKTDSDIYAKLDVSLRSFDGLETIEKLSPDYRLLHSREEVWDMSKFTSTESVLQQWEKFLDSCGTLKLNLTLTVHLDRSANTWISSICNQPIRSRLRQMLRNKSGEQHFDVMFTIGKWHFEAHRRVIKCNPILRSILQRSDPQSRLIDLPNFRPESFANLIIDSYIQSNLFCKKCCIYRVKGTPPCCDAKTKYGC